MIEPWGDSWGADQSAAEGAAIGDAIAANAAGPAEVETDAGRVKQHSLADQIAADKYLAGKSAVASPSRGLRITRLVPPGAS